MKWFKHDCSARNDTKLKLLKKKFKAEGYGIYFQLIEIIGENVKDNNKDDWGFVESIHNLDTLADECGVSRDKLGTVLEYCNEIGLLYKLDNRLCAPKILLRLDEYASKRKKDFDVIQREIDLTRQCTDSVPTEAGENRGLEQKRIEEKRTEQYSSIASLTDDVCESIASQYSVTSKVVINLREELKLYCQSKGKTYKDYRAALMNWLRRRMDEGKVTKIKATAAFPMPEDVPLTEEQRQANITRIAQIKANYPVRSV
jgi:hypothetical protein